jgi:hypothetical protein
MPQFKQKVAVATGGRSGSTPAKLDLKRQFRQFYSAATSPELVDVPPMQFLMIDGTGDPSTSPDYAAAIVALYAVSFGLKFAIKRGPIALDYSVMPLEGLWWADDMAAFRGGQRDHWQWTAMIMQPDVITQRLVAETVAAAAKKHPSPAFDKLRFQTLTEGHAAQLLHIGPYADEAPDITRLHAFVAEQGGKLTGKHHEIYLGDPGRVAPEKLRTILRQPFTREA